MGDLEDLTIAEDIAAAGRWGKLDGRMAAGVIRIEAGEDFAETVGVRRLNPALPRHLTA